MKGEGPGWATVGAVALRWKRTCQPCPQRPQVRRYIEVGLTWPDLLLLLLLVKRMACSPPGPWNMHRRPQPPQP